MPSWLARVPVGLSPAFRRPGRGSRGRQGSARLPLHPDPLPDGHGHRRLARLRDGVRRRAGRGAARPVRRGDRLQLEGRDRPLRRLLHLPAGTEQPRVAHPHGNGDRNGEHPRDRGLPHLLRGLRRPRRLALHLRRRLGGARAAPVDQPQRGQRDVGSLRLSSLQQLPDQRRRAGFLGPHRRDLERRSPPVPGGGPVRRRPAAEQRSVPARGRGAHRLLHRRRRLPAAHHGAGAGRAHLPRHGRPEGSPTPARQG